MTMVSVISPRHTKTPHATDDQTLQQSRAFPRGALAPVLTVAVRIGEQFRFIGFKLFPRNVSRIHIGQKHRPFFSLQASVAKLSTNGNFALAGSTIAQGSRVTGVVQNA